VAASAAGSLDGDVGACCDNDPVRIRDAGRAIVLDPDDRLLLLRYDDDPPDGRHWSTPGGGLNPGESFADGAARELAEETGWTDVQIGSQVYEAEFDMDYGNDDVLRHHWCFFLARVSTRCREVADVDGMHESDRIAAWRWWPLNELLTTSEVIRPTGLVAAVADLLRDEPR
jgi:ADP-ribose pyrophosphatase YjhB (NUDIX family)